MSEHAGSAAIERFLASMPSDAAEAAVDGLRLDEIARLAGLAASYWHSVAFAAARGDAMTVAVHCRQAASVTRAVFAVLKALEAREIGP